MESKLTMKKIFTFFVFGHLFIFSNTVLANNEHPARFSVNVGNLTTISLSPSSTFGESHSVTHPSNFKEYDQIAFGEENEITDEPKPSASSKNDPNLCSDNEFGVEFYCEPTWKWRRVEDAIMIIISSQPMVTMTISKINSPVKFLGQITDVRRKRIIDSCHN